ncbi:acyltransferase family protein [Trujillonella humicola]|uniref:acyltransferase family protein n=1 Tax=Trujillonella humicola TaxID=3383699 RepID=UPI003906C94C
MPRSTGRVHELAARTPPGRNRVVDLVRAAAILFVVLGHWLVVVVRLGDDGTLSGVNLLGIWPPAQPMTWVFQVMPLFFLVGGYAGAAAWISARRSGQDGLRWLDGRLRRLLRPTTAFLLVAVSAAALARLAGVDPELVATAGWVAGIALWFLAVYLALTALTPLVVQADERYGLGVPAALAGAAAVVDVLRLSAGVPAVELLNFVLVWLCLLALGVAWHSGRLTGSPWPPALLAGGGLAVLVGLVALGPYPVSMVNVPGDEFHNTAPPSLALLALGLTQAGLVLLACRALDRLAHRPRVWLATVALNGVILSVFLWHMVPVVAAGLLLYGTGLFPQPEPASAQWFALRPVWVLACAVLLAGVVALVARFERVPRQRRPPPSSGARLAGVALGVASCCAGLALLTVDGLSTDGPAGLPLPGLAAYALGLAAITAATRGASAHRGTGRS